MSNQFYANLKNIQSQPAPLNGRVERQEIYIGTKPPSAGARFSKEKRTFIDPNTGEVVTMQSAEESPIGCGCLILNPAQIRGLCPECARLDWRGRWRNPQLICHKHSVCLACERRRQGRGIVRRAFWFVVTVLLWPVADVTR